jgi:predicted metal-dependent hydrolase
VAEREQTAFPFAGTAPAAAEARGQARPARRAEAPRLNLQQQLLQLGVPDEAARQRLENRIAAHLRGGRLALAVTDNRYTMIAVKRERGLYRVRLHHMFLEADPAVVRALARYIGENDRQASELLGRFIDGHQGRIRRLHRKPSQLPTIETQGQVHDLKAIFDELNETYFAGRIHAQITWGGGRSRRKRRHNSIKMGSYSVEDRLIRVHPSLDRGFVPRYFVDWIVFHEMLHQVYDIPVVAGRRQFHTAEFRAAEKTFVHYAKASKWEKDHLSELLNY